MTMPRGKRSLYPPLVDPALDKAIKNMPYADLKICGLKLLGSSAEQLKQNKNRGLGNDEKV
jgi:hypothetical protein